MTHLPNTPLTPDQESRMIESARNDSSAFAPLYRFYVSPIYRYLYSRLGNASDAEDLTSQEFVEAMESLSRYHHRGYFAAWLFSIARHRLINLHRQRKFTIDIENREYQEIQAGDPLEKAIANEEKNHLLEIIDSLDEKEQELLRLRYVAGLNFAEIGVVLNRNKEAVKKQLYRLLARLASYLEADND